MPFKECARSKRLTDDEEANAKATRNNDHQIILRHNLSANMHKGIR